jgi:hypothetical protein
VKKLQKQGVLLRREGKAPTYELVEKAGH